MRKAHRHFCLCAFDNQFPPVCSQYNTGYRLTGVKITIFRRYYYHTSGVGESFHRGKRPSHKRVLIFLHVSLFYRRIADCCMDKR
jgi:hypothetical protein